MSWDIGQVKREIRGPAGLAMATFDDDLRLDVEALKGNLRYMVDNGVGDGRGFVICPSGTGEYLSLSDEEHLLMTETALEVCEGKMAVVSGVAGVNQDDVIARTDAARRAGARYAMVPPPFYYGIDQQGVFDWYRILSESVDIGVMIYDQSWRVGLGTTLTPPLIERLSGLDNIVSLKYGSPNLIKDMPVVIDRFADRFAFIDNSLGFTSVSSHMHGATGYISGPVTWWPEFELSFFDLMERGRYAEADRWHARLAPYMAWHHGEHWKSGRYVFDAAVVKASLEYVGLHGGPVRPPFRALDAGEKAELWETIEGIGLERPAHAAA